MTPTLRTCWACLAVALCTPALAADVGIGPAVLAHLAATQGIHASMALQLDLGAPFHTATPWALAVARQPDDDGFDASGLGNMEGAVLVCFVHAGQPDCEDAPYRARYRELGVRLQEGERPFYELLQSRIVHDATGRPLLSLKTCTAHGGNSNCAVATWLFRYDIRQDRFELMFSNATGRNNNQETRFIEHGPLRGAVVVAVPPEAAPFHYGIELYQPAADGRYRLKLRYRGRTVYGDGNPLPVIDSEMPALLARLGRWKAGDPLPVPPTMPAGCTRLGLRRGVEWCDAAAGRVTPHPG